ncbi:MAG: peptidylprolyl isomerase [Oscillatoriophycideae cyanobacterium NC_groundwater_1537_Pr4_S-0.65um_50_18]|jgi:parvulin-like peptidyl-prolyl isomerase|nr:peptidylprolyl isomerase [Oscillatoriophycideae cyanobacterium NC_groundwater_1537_Pr4_S-0.65um_50_18]
MATLQRSSIQEADLIPRLASYQMLPQIRRERIIDEAIAPILCSEAEITKACQQFYEQNQLIDETTRQDWLTQQEISLGFLETILIPRLLKIEKFKHQTWNHKLESYFLQRKSDLDRVIYSLIQIQDAEMAEELYFRIYENEQSFAEVAHKYSQGSEAQVNGIIGPVELGTQHPALAYLLAISQPGQLWHPVPVDEWLLIVRLEKLLPAQLNISMRQRLLQELFEAWVQEQT